jgi:hypothetical protein
MTKMNLTDAAASLHPLTDFTLKEKDGKLIRIKFLDSDITAPTEDELIAERDRMQGVYDGEKYKRDRESAYPLMEDYLDGIVKDDQDQIDKYRSDCLAVKVKYPKPE